MALRSWKDLIVDEEGMGTVEVICTYKETLLN